MNKTIFAILIVVFSIKSHSQINFDKGYYINNKGDKVEGFIKNLDWKNNPTEIEFRLSDDTSPEKIGISTIQEFGIDRFSKYVRCRVQIDRSSSDIDKLTVVREAWFKEEELFLKVLIEGKTSLFSFEDGNLNRYFYSIDDDEIVQLVFRKYLNKDNKIATNYGYKQQLWTDLKCPEISRADVEKVSYTKSDLIDFFSKFNQCSQQEFTNFEEYQKKDLFNLSIRPGLNFSSLSIKNSISNAGDTDFDNEFGLRIGIESEFILPFNRNKWAIFLEPTYQYFTSEKELNTHFIKATVDYSSIELPVGLRHYFFLNENSKLFFNGSYIFDFRLKSEVDFEFGTDLESKTRGNFAFGLGYKHNDRYIVELRYQTNREILSDYLDWSSDYSTFSVIFGYSVF